MKLGKLQSTTCENQVLVPIIKAIIFSSRCTLDSSKHGKVRSTFKVKHNQFSKRFSDYNLPIFKEI